MIHLKSAEVEIRFQENERLRLLFSKVRVFNMVYRKRWQQ